nr:hypothetical protein [Jiangella alkaliphila]
MNSPSSTDTPVRRVRVGVALPPQLGRPRRPVPGTQQRYAAPPAGQQVRNGLARRFAVVGADVIDLAVQLTVAYQHERVVGVADRHVLRRQRHRADDDAVSEQLSPAQDAQLDVAVALRGLDQHLQPAAAGLSHHRGREVGEVPLVQARHRQRDGGRAAATQPLRDRVRPIVERRDARLNPLAGRRCHMRVAVDDVGHRPLRHPGMTRHVMHAHRHATRLRSSPNITNGKEPARRISTVLHPGRLGRIHPHTGLARLPHRVGRRSIVAPEETRFIG